MPFLTAKRRVINCLLLAIPALGQNFEVASVKPSQPVAAGQPSCATGKFTAQTSLRLTIAWAFGVGLIQLDGSDKWPTARLAFAIEGVPAGPASVSQCRVMVQSLLAERFKLAVHRESRTMPVLAITVAKNGPKIKRVADTDAVRRKGSHSCAAPSKGSTLQDLAGCLDVYLYPTLVVDHTGLSGNYEILLDFAPPRPGGTGLLGDGPDVFSALESQLGLKLEQRNEPVEVIVIDHLEPPEAN